MTDTTRKIALITGGSRGLGRSTALSVARRGVGVVLTFKNSQAKAESAVAEINALGGVAVALPLDTSDVATFATFASSLMAALKSTWGRDTFDYLVNNAGEGAYASIADTTEAQFDAMVNVHLKGVFFLTQALAPLMADHGRIVNLSSGLARFTMPGYAAYAAMKGGVEVLTRYMAKEFGARGIAVNTVAPGAIATDFGGGVVRDDAQIQAHITSVTALGRVGEPGDVGPMIAALLGAENRWVTAQRIEVSGGANI